MNTIAAQEIKRRGLAAIDEAIKEGPLHIIKNNKPHYVILTETRYKELLAVEDEAYLDRVKASLADIKAGRIQRFKSVEQLMKAIEKDV